MQNFNEIFFNKGFEDITKKNMEFTKKLFQTNSGAGQEIVKQKVNEYFQFVNTNLEFLSSCYDKSVATNCEMVELYRENTKKIYEISKEMMDKVTPGKKA
ncbi:MAG: phasin family protein [Candidatus Wallbacteria bacterium]|nr:phasin family protein [Candidatus Wallbacteria bacterium]